MLAVIGGTGLYQLEQIDLIRTHSVKTPFGEPSADIVEGKINQRSVLFLPRHGSYHQFLPHEVNYRANIWALKSLGASHVIGVSAAGSLQQEIVPGEISLPNQYFDFVKGQRQKTFFGNGVAAHVSTAEPTCPDLSDDLAHAAQSIGIHVHRNKTYACVDGPRLGTKAESNFLRGSAACDLVGMTNVPEVFLAREAQMAYCTIAIATDYDCWQDDPSLHVSVEQVISRYGASLDKAKQILLAFMNGSYDLLRNQCHNALSTSLLTPLEKLSADQKSWLNVLLK